MPSATEPVDSGSSKPPARSWAGFERWNRKLHFYTGLFPDRRHRSRPGVPQLRSVLPGPPLDFLREHFPSLACLADLVRSLCSRLVRFPKQGVRKISFRSTPGSVFTVFREACA